MGFNATQLAGVSMASQIGGAATSGIGSYFGAATQQSNLQGSAAVAEANARINDTNMRIADVHSRIAELGAQSTLRQGEREVGKLTMRAGQLKSRQRVAMAANGIDLGSANARDIRESTDLMKEVDVSTLESNAMRSAWGYRTEAMNARIQKTNIGTQSMNLRNQALASRAEGSVISPIGGATSSLLGSAGNVANSWYRFRKEGA